MSEHTSNNSPFRPGDRLLTVEQAAEILAAPKRYVYQVTSETGGTLSHRKIGRKIRIWESDLIKWIEGHRVDPSGPDDTGPTAA